ncbi:hypothetical protein GGR04_003969 [Aureimonas pseudogalii]|uniref:Uncharacterized protein n=1 Tax=Aureimonas pseudogalii TaxID=1744844 RepID=A0A7W6MLS5_9HYPH|nr:hypothetical protein [Aureimonas pseudogalii]MBB4000093.1 hypothetical protein [Aureimonas pseudogalii]
MARRSKNASTFRRQPDALGMAVKNGEPELILEPIDDPAQRVDASTKIESGLTETLTIGDGDQNLDPIPIDVVGKVYQNSERPRV